MAVNPAHPFLTAWDGTTFQVLAGGVFDEAATKAALDAYQAANPPPAPEPPEEPASEPDTWTNKYAFMLLFRDDERARYRQAKREAAALPVDLTTPRHQLLDAFADFLELFDRLRDEQGINRADPKTALSLQLFVALGIIDPAEAAWRVPQVLAAQVPTASNPGA